MIDHRQRSDTSATWFVGVFFVLALPFVTVMTLSGCSDPVSRPGKGIEMSELIIRTKTAEHVFKVELALDEDSQQRGLMFRRSMPADHGMLFVYEREHIIGMWMKNTVLSLDMLFVRQDGRIARIARRAEPFSETVLSSIEPVYGVLELNGGTADELSIKVGDRVIHPLLSADQSKSGN